MGFWDNRLSYFSCYSIVAAFVTMAAVNSTTAEAEDFPPERFLGEMRILALCGGANLPTGLNWKSFQDRDLVVIEPHDDRLVFSIYEYEGRYVAAPFASSARLNTTMNCASETEYVLIGKDSGVKKRWENSLPLVELIQTIDAMPMRQYEMRTRGSN